MASSATVLVADIGGTYSRFGLVDGGEAPMTPRAIRTLVNDSYEDLSAAITAYLADVKAAPGSGAFAVAGPTGGDVVTMTNRAWSFSVSDLARAHGLAHLDVVNDFVALARALPFLRPDELTPIGSAAPRDDATKLALGPGTGLGVAGLLHVDGRWIAVPSEAGHVEFAAIGAREHAMFEVLRKRFGRVAAETAISGNGLCHLDSALATLDGQPAPDRAAADIVAAAGRGEARALEAIETMLAMLARFAGDMALAFVALGGVYFAGGVLTHIAGFARPDTFRALFTDKDPYAGLLAGIGTVLVNLDDQPALRGCAAIAADHAWTTHR